MFSLQIAMVDKNEVVYRDVESKIRCQSLKSIVCDSYSYAHSVNVWREMRSEALRVWPAVVGLSSPAYHQAVAGLKYPKSPFLIPRPHSTDEFLKEVQWRNFYMEMDELALGMRMGYLMAQRLSQTDVKVGGVRREPHQQRSKDVDRCSKSEDDCWNSWAENFMGN